MTPDGRFWHYIKPNEVTRVPRRHVFLDTEANKVDTKYGEEQIWRLGVAQFWDNEKGRKEHERTIVYDSPDSLWKDVADHCRPKSRTVLWAHNLGYDVRIAEALVILPREGWTLVAHNLSGKSCWLYWRKGTASLLMVDSASVFPLSLEQVGEHFRLGKPPLPAFDDERGLWEARCRADVEILATAIKAYLKWIETDDLGNWQQTGAGQSWATFRHKFMSHKLLVHDDERALRGERRAMWTGRAEAYYHGAVKHSTVHEWDLTLAYARIARDHPVPTRLVGTLPDGDAWKRYVNNPKVTFLAEVDVHTDVPVVPAEVEGHVAWPVGDFRTTLWAPELKAAIDAGAAVSVRGGWLYRTEPALKDWATWIIGLLEDSTGVVPAWQKVILKHWARALIGRFAMTYTSWDPVATAPTLQTRRVMFHDLRTDTPGELLQVGHELFEKSGVQEWQHSMPSITGYIMSLCRVRLWDIMQACPDKAVLYVDTDSILATDEFHDQIKAIADSPIGHGLRLKRSWDGVEIWGPRQIVTGRVVRVAGIPKRATQVDDQTFVGEVWESLDAAMRRGRFNRVHIARRQWRMKGFDRRRVGPARGWTKPHTIMRT
jgi:hypothetical protein